MMNLNFIIAYFSYFFQHTTFSDCFQHTLSLYFRSSEATIPPTPSQPTPSESQRRMSVAASTSTQKRYQGELFYGTVGRTKKKRHSSNESLQYEQLSTIEKYGTIRRPSKNKQVEILAKIEDE